MCWILKSGKNKRAFRKGREAILVAGDFMCELDLLQVELKHFVGGAEETRTLTKKGSVSKAKSSAKVSVYAYDVVCAMINPNKRTVLVKHTVSNERAV